MPLLNHPVFSNCIIPKYLSNVYRPPSCFSFSKPFSVFVDEFNFFLSIGATTCTPHEFIITGDFNLHLDNQLITLILITLPLNSSLFSLL